MHFRQLNLEHLKFIETFCFQYIPANTSCFCLVSSSSYEMNMDWVVVQCYRTWDHMVLHCSEYIGRKWRNAFILSFHFFIDTWLSLVITVLLTIFQYFHHFWLLLIHNGFNGISDFEMSLIWILNDNGGSLVMKN